MRLCASLVAGSLVPEWTADAAAAAPIPSVEAAAGGLAAPSRSATAPSRSRRRPAKAKASPNATGEIVGVVMSRDTGTPLAGVAVTMAQSALSAITASDGTFTLRAIPSGRYLLQARLEGLEPRDDSVTVIAGQTSRSTLQMRRPNPLPDTWEQDHASIVGRVTARGGAEVVRHAHVRFSEGVSEDVLTDVKGFFYLRDLPPGRHELSIGAMGYDPGAASVLVDQRHSTIVLIDLGSSLTAGGASGERAPSPATDPASYRPLADPAPPPADGDPPAGPGEIRFLVARNKGEALWPAVSLEVRDASDQLVRRLVTWELAPGRYKIFWDGADDAGRKVVAGTYRYRLRVGEEQPEESLVSIP